MRLAALCAAVLLAGVASAEEPPVLALVGGTLVDGNGGEPVRDAALLIRGDRIVAAGPAGDVEIPAQARRIDTRRRWLLPGFIDTNVHLSLYGGHTPPRYETLVRYADRQEEVILEGAQLQLKHGVTTVRDSYGVLPSLIAVRDRIARGEAVGARLLVAGNIVGWGGPFSVSFSLIPRDGLTLFQERMNDLVTQGVGEELMELTPAELGVAMEAYLDKGPDFIKYGGTAHFESPIFIGFSPEAQRVIVEATHARGRIVEAHATSAEGLRLAVEAGVDLVQHPEMLGDRELPEALVKSLVERDVICSMLVNTLTGEAWKRHLEERARVEGAEEPWRTGHQGVPAERDPTTAERRRWAEARGDALQVYRRNAQRLIAAGCTTTVGTDNYRSAAPAFARGPKPPTQDAGIGTILAIEGLVELGMTPARAIVAATRNGARACGALDELGTLEAGKRADVVVLEADPLDDIRNVRRLALVVQGGQLVDTESLPEHPVFYRGEAAEPAR